MAFCHLLIIFFIFIYLQKKSDGCSSIHRLDYTFNEAWAGFYKVHYNAKSWEKARLICQMEGATLAMPYTNKEAMILSQLVNPAQFARGIFVGVKEMQSKGDYRTIKGASFCRIPHQWAKDEPNSFRDSCLVLLRDGTFADEPCSETLPFVCYKKFDAECNACRNPCNTKDPDYKFEQSTGSCYKFHNIGNTWGEAVRTCADEGGHLVMMNSATETTILKRIFADNPPATIVGTTYLMFVGFHDMFIEGDYLSLDGKKFTVSNIASWARNQPDNLRGNENCGTMYRSGTLNDLDCAAKCPFICEIETEPICH